MKKQLMTAAGIVAGLGAMVLPLSSYADNSATTQITANVAGSISITATNAITIGDLTATPATLVPGTSGTATIALHVETNVAGGFNVTATPTALAKGSDTINYNAAAAAGTRGWSIQGEGDASAFSGTGVLWTFGNASTVSASEDKNFTVTVGTDTTTPTGTYTGSISFVAANN